MVLKKCQIKVMYTCDEVHSKVSGLQGMGEGGGCVGRGRGSVDRQGVSHVLVMARGEEYTCPSLGQKKGYHCPRSQDSDTPFPWPGPGLGYPHVPLFSPRKGPGTRDWGIPPLPLPQKGPGTRDQGKNLGPETMVCPPPPPPHFFRTSYTGSKHCWRVPSLTSMNVWRQTNVYQRLFKALKLLAAIWCYFFGET